MDNRPRFLTDRIVAWLGVAAGVLIAVRATPWLGLSLLAGELQPHPLLGFALAVGGGSALAWGSIRIGRSERGGFLLASPAALATGLSAPLVALGGAGDPLLFPGRFEIAVGTLVLAYALARLVDWGPRPASPPNPR